MFTIELEIPGDDEKSPCYVVDKENLDKVINTCGEDVLNPDFSPKINIELLWTLFEEFIFFSLYIFEFGSTFDNDMVCEEPN